MILISGSQGFIGSHLYDSFDKCVGLDKVHRGREQLFLRQDLLDYEALFWSMKDFEFEYVFHQAAVPSVPDSYKDPMKTYVNNVNASINLIKACKATGVKKLIFASSSSVNGPSPYGHSKKVIEDLLPHSGLNYTILRYFNVVGPRQRENVASIMLDKIKKDQTVTFFGDGKTSRDFSHINNVIVANKKAMHSKYDGQTLDVGTGKSHTLEDLYRGICARVKPHHHKIDYWPERIGDIKYSKSNTFLDSHEITHFDKGLDLWLSGDNLNG